MASDLARRYLPQFREQAQARLTLLHGLLAAGPAADLAAVGFQMHALAGEASMLGLGAVVDAAREGERVASAGVGGHGQETARCTAIVRQLAALLELSPGAAPPLGADSLSAPRRPAVLVVDDSPIVAETVGDALQDAGFDVTLADTLDGVEAALAQRRPDVVVTDMLMPGFDAASIAALLRRDGQRPPPLVLVSGRTADELAAEIDRIGAQAAVSKQEGIEAIVGRVLELVATSS